MPETPVVYPIQLILVVVGTSKKTSALNNNKKKPVLRFCMQVMEWLWAVLPCLNYLCHPRFQRTCTVEAHHPGKSSSRETSLERCCSHTSILLSPCPYLFSSSLRGAVTSDPESPTLMLGFDVWRIPAVK